MYRYFEENLSDIDMACETCAHSYPCDIYGNDLACEYNDKVVWKNYEETDDYMNCKGFCYKCYKRGCY